MNLTYKIIIIFSLLVNICFGQETDGFTYKTPNYKNNIDSLFYNSTIQKIEQLKLESFENGIDSLGIRIWFNSSPKDSDFNELLELKFINSKWSGIYYSFLIVRDNDSDITITKSNNLSIIPKFSWDIIYCGLTTFDILSLPLDFEMKSENLDNDKGILKFIQESPCSMIILEIATPSMYRFYEYFCPEYFSALNPDVKKMNDFLNFVKSQFSVFDSEFKLREKYLKKQATQK